MKNEIAYKNFGLGQDSYLEDFCSSTTKQNHVGGQLILPLAGGKYIMVYFTHFNGANKTADS